MSSTSTMPLGTLPQAIPQPIIAATVPTTVPSTIVPSSTYGSWVVRSFQMQSIGSTVTFQAQLNKCLNDPILGIVLSPSDVPQTVFIPDIRLAAQTDPNAQALLAAIVQAITNYAQANKLL